MPNLILIVDDNAAIRRSLRAFIELQPDFEVCGEAVDGMEALEKARELRSDMIIMDLSMPRLNGLQASSALKQIVPNAPIVLYTMHKEAVSVRQANEVGIASVVSKADQIALLGNELRRLATN